MVAAFSAWLFTGWIAVIPAAVAWADCSGAGDFGAGSGCPPPGDTSGSGSGESWPPTSVDWPPSQSSDSGDSAGGGGGGDTSTPIVMPDGQQAPTHGVGTKHESSSSTPPTPIVPVGAPVTGPAPSVIVTPSSSTP
jgi:hypothetical protein